MENIYWIIGIILLSSIVWMTPMGPTETVMFLIFVIIIAIMGIKYYYNIDITTYIKGLFTKPNVKMIVSQHQDKDIDLPIQMDNTVPSKPVDTVKPISTGRKQVFHVPGQYDYLEAKAVCRAYGGELANISQMMDAYNKGGEWCDYGWAEDRMALYPTQYSTWKSLKEEGREGECGVPGVNGGYVEGSYSLGVNCYANKPLNMQNPMQTMPQSVEEVELNQRASYWKSKLPKLKVDPFNYTSWSM